MSFSMPLRTVLLAILFLLSGCRAGDAQTEAPALLPAPERTGQFPASVAESSGLVKSRKYPDKDVFWTHGDSGNKETLFAVTSKGQLLREVPIPGCKNKDWEEIGADAAGHLIIADIGDNRHKREQIVLYRLPEPDAFDHSGKAAAPEAFRFTYPKNDGPQDAEALFVLGDNAYLLTKDIQQTRMYRLPLPQAAPKDSVAAEKIAETRAIAAPTGAALSADGRHLALVGYLAVHVFDLPEGARPAEYLAAPHRSRVWFLGQTEAVAWDGEDLVVSTEGGAVYRIKNAAGSK